MSGELPQFTEGVLKENFKLYGRTPYNLTRFAFFRDVDCIGSDGWSLSI